MKKMVIIFFLIINFVMYNAIADSVVHKIYCNGLQRVPLDSVLSILPIKIGNIVDEYNISDCIKILFHTGYFEEVFILNSEGIISIEVKEWPVINTIKICKNKVVKSELIQEILNKKNIKSGYPLNNCSINEAKQELENICHNFGKLNATVQLITIPLDRNRLNLQVVFCEGKFIKVKNINIFGNRSFSQKRLLKNFSLYNQLKYKYIRFYKVYQKQRLFYDLEKLKNFYLNNGYAKFSIDDIQINLTSDKNNVNIVIYITEGYQYTIQSVVMYGDILDRIPELGKKLQIEPGKLYNNKKIIEMEYNIQYVLRKFGYIQPDITVEYNFNDQNKIIKLYLYVDTGKRLYVRDIRFEGNDVTRDSVLRREIQQMEQTPLNYNTVLKDQKQLQSLNYLKSVNTRFEYISNSSDQINLIYNVEERNSGALNLSFGFGAESGVNMQIALHQENFLGTGDTISVTAIKNNYQTYFDTSILKKYFGIKKSNISGKIFYNNFVYNKINLSNYNMKNYGANISYLYPLNISKSYDIGLNYIVNDLHRIVPQVAIWRYLYSLNLDPLNFVNHNNLNDNISFKANDMLLVLTWTLNNLDKNYFPRYGSFISVINSITLPGSSNNYYKIIVDNSNYMSLDKYSNWVLMNGIYIGYAGGLYKHKESPFYDNFYIGGIGTIRGFQFNSIGPKAAYYKCRSCDKNYSTCIIKDSSDTVGGNAIFLIKSELEVPILSSCINISEYYNIIRTLLFIDAGTVWDTYWKNTAATCAAGILDYSVYSHIRISSGIALKWISPIGPIVVSYAKLVKKYSGDIEEPFQFSIGKSWR